MKNLIIFLLICFKTIDATAQVDSSLTHQFFVKLKGVISPDTLTAYLEDLNCVEIWRENYSGVALWQAKSFPFTTSDGTQVLDINTIIRQSVRKTQISEATANMVFGLGDIDDTNTGSTFNPLDYSLAQGTERAVKIAILDTGISPNIGSSTTPDLNYNLVSYTGHDYVRNDNIPNDEHGHGSHIAGIIHSITNGVDSLGNKVQFYIFKTHDTLGQAKMSHVVKALIDAVDNNVDIVNMSFGMLGGFEVDSFFPLRSVIQHALDKKVLIIAAAGNSGLNIDNYSNTAMPAGFPEENIISVSALDGTNNLTSFSNFGANTTDIGALGFKVPGPNRTGGLKYSSGTSQATAIVTGVAALVATYQNNFKINNIKCALTNGDANIPALVGKSVYEGKVNSNLAKTKYQNLQPNYNVNNLLDIGAGSFRDAIEGVCGVESINFNTSINTTPINISSKPILLPYDMTIIGNGLSNTIINGQNIPVLKIGYNANISLGNINFTHSNSVLGSILNNGRLVITNTVKIE